MDARTHLQSEIAKTGRPVCYNNGQFTMTAPPLVFSCTVPFEIEPIDFHRPHFFVWLPHLFQRIPCPSCEDTKRSTKQGILMKTSSRRIGIRASDTVSETPLGPGIDVG